MSWSGVGSPAEVSITASNLISSAMLSVILASVSFFPAPPFGINPASCVRTFTSPEPPASSTRINQMTSPFVTAIGVENG